MEYSGSPSYDGICLRPVDKPSGLPNFSAGEKSPGRQNRLGQMLIKL